MAAGGSDGSLIFKTEINVDGFEEGLSTLSKAMDRLTQAVESLSSNILSKFNGAGQAVTETAQKAEETAEAVSDIGEAADQSAAEVKSLQEQMDAITITFTEDPGKNEPEPEPPRTVPIRPEDEAGYGYDQEAIRFVEEYGQAAANAEKEVNEFKAEIGALSAKMKELESQGMYFGDDEYDEAYIKLAKVKQALADYKKEMLNPTPDVEIPVKFDENSFEGQKQKLKNKLSEFEKQGITFKNPEYDSTYAALQRVTQAEQEYKKSLLDTDQAQKKTAKSADGMSGKLRNTHKEAIPLTKSILKLSNMFKLMVLRMAMKAVIESVKEGFQNLAQYSGGVNTTLSSLMSSMLYLKNSFATAFAPILDIVVPALNAMIDAIANALAWIGQFLAALTGKGSFVKAKKTQEDYAKGLKKTGGAAKQAGKDAERLIR